MIHQTSRSGDEDIDSFAEPVENYTPQETVNHTGLYQWETQGKGEGDRFVSSSVCHSLNHDKHDDKWIQRSDFSFVSEVSLL